MTLDFRAGVCYHGPNMSNDFANKPAKKPKYGSVIPEVRDTIEKYGCHLWAHPPYIIQGKYTSKSTGSYGGMLAAADNELHAHIIRTALERTDARGSACVFVERTEYHSSGATFSIDDYRKKLRAIADAKRKIK